MTDERAYIAFRTDEPVILNLTGTEYPKIKRVIISKTEPRSLHDKINVRSKIIFYYVLQDKSGSILQCGAEDITETRPEPPPQIKQILLKGFVGA